MDLNLLRVFEAVFRERHLTRAAEVLALTPSAVSHALRRLREELGEPLFERAGTSMVPTATCQRMAPLLLDQLAGLRGLLLQWGRFDPAQAARTFRVSMPEAVEPMLLPPLLRSFALAAPGASLASVTVERSSLSRVLASRHLDLSIDVALPIAEPVRHQPLLEDDFCLVVREGHPLPRKPSLSQYLTARHVVVSSRATGTVLEDHALLQAGVQRRVGVRCQSYTSALRVVAQSDDVLTVPSRVAIELGSSLALSRRRLPIQLPPVQIHSYWHSNHDADPASVWLRDLVLEVSAAPRSPGRRPQRVGTMEPG